MPPRAIRGLAAAVLLILAAAVAPAAAQSPPTPPPAPDETPSAGETGYVVVRRAVDPDVLRQIEGIPSLEERGYESLRVPDGMSQAEFLDELRAQPDIESAEPDARVYAANTPDDPYYANPGQEQRGYLESIGMPQAWDQSIGSDEVVVATLDSGIDTSHPDLAPNLWVNEDETVGNGQDDDQNGCIDDRHGCRFLKVNPQVQQQCGYLGDQPPNGNIRDDSGATGSSAHSHGTLVGGIIGAAGNNDQGIAGVSWNVRLMPVKVLDCGSRPSGFMSDVAKGIDYARRMGADVINLSLAAPPTDSSANQSALRDAIAAAEEEGVIIVAAAGNNGTEANPGPGYPAAYAQFSNLVTVGASDWIGGHSWASYSAYGPSLDFAAPGNRIVSTIRTDLGISVPYGRAEAGTSFAAPIVSGTFALMISRNGSLEMQEYIDLARETALPAPDAIHGGNWAGSGVINAGGALARVPMYLTGRAQHNWVDLPEGTRVDARVDGFLCGTTETTAVGAVSRFELLVDPAAVKSGCGAPGDEVSIFVDGSQSEARVAWGGPQEELVRSSIGATTISPDPGPLVAQPLQPGWNNIGHLEAPGQVPEALNYLPPSWDSAHWWDSSGHSFLRLVNDAPGYVQQWESVNTYEAYWVLVDGTANAGSVNPEPPSGRTIELDEGWNNFVYTGESRRVDLALEDIDGSYESVYRYNNETTQWQSYIPGRTTAFNTVGGLLKLQVYWLYATEDVSLTMD